MALDSNDVFPVYRGADGTNRKASIGALLAMGGGVNNGTVSFTGSQGITYPSTNSFTLNQAGDVTIDIAGPDLSNYLVTPSTDGNFVVSVASGAVTYTSFESLEVDGGIYAT